MTVKHAVLLALPGTSGEEAAETLRAVDEKIGRRFGVPRFWAYTSSGVRRKLEAAGRPVDGPKEAFDRMRGAGVTHVAVKALHLAPGVEYEELRDLAEKARRAPEGFERIVLSAPLLASPADVIRMAQCLLAAIPSGPAADEALLLAAHGSRRRDAQSAYGAAADLCRRLDRRVILGTMMSSPGLADVVRECRAEGVRKVWLAPLMVIAGSSARNDLGSAGPGSWRSELEREGIGCEPVLKGLGDNDGIVRMWIEDIARLLADISGPDASP